MSISYKDMSEEQKARYREYHNSYYHEHKEVIKEQRKGYKKPYKYDEKRKAYQAEYYQKNKEKIAEQRKKRRGLTEKVKVVRCKDCRFATMTTDNKQCKYCENDTDDFGNMREVYHDANWYCADGERRIEKHERKSN